MDELDMAVLGLTLFSLGCIVIGACLLRWGWKS